MKNTIIDDHGLAPRVDDLEELKRIVAAHRVFGRTIGLVMGVWDMFHPGHAEYLRKASEFVDILIVGVDSDEMVRFNKSDKPGPSRPFDPQDERIRIIQALRTTSIVTLRTNLQQMDDTLVAVRPDVLIVSKSTGPELQAKIKEFEQYARRVENLEPQSSNSTTAKIRRLQGETFAELRATINDALTHCEERINGKGGSP